MREVSFIHFAIAAIVSATVFAPAKARAASDETFVSGSANPTNTACTRAAPCTTFSAAYDRTNAGGEIVCIDSGNFGQFNIDRSVTVNCSGTNGHVTAAASTISITTGANDIVVLKGLDLDSDGTSFSGSAQFGVVDFTGAGVLQVENTRISNRKGFGYNGIHFAPTGIAKLIVADSLITGMGTGSTVAGIDIKPASGVTVSVSIERSRIDNNYFGIIADGTAGGIIHGLISDSFVTNNVNNGITASTGSSHVSLTVDNTKISGNAFGLVAGGGANAGMIVRRSIINNNTTGLYTNSGAALYSYRDNSVNGNFGGDGAFTGSINLQ